MILIYDRGMCQAPSAAPPTRIVWPDSQQHQRSLWPNHADTVPCITLAYVGKVRDRIFTISEDFANGHISNNFYKVCSFKHLRNVKLDIYGNFDIVFALFGHRFYTQKSENHRDPTVICRTFSVISPSPHGDFSNGFSDFTEPLR